MSGESSTRPRNRSSPWRYGRPSPTPGFRSAARRAYGRLNEPLVIASTDAGDVSWVVPTGWIHAATHVPGVVNHSWQASACAGTSIGRKGMVVAAKTLALTGVELLTDPSQLKAARDSFDQRRAGRAYKSRLPADAKPPLDYRK